MSDPFIGQISMFAGNFAPRGWAFCNGQLLSISQNSALFAILGTTYGGDGQATFGLPDLRGRVPTGQGQGPGLPAVVLGEVAGTPSTTLTINQLPTHNHSAVFQGSASQVGAPTIDVGTSSANALANPTNGSTTYLTAVTAATNLGDTVDFHGLFTSTAPASGATGSLGGVHGGGTVTPAGTVTVGATGNGLPFSIAQPYLGVSFIIAVEGIFPSRN
ncbi:MULTISPECIES: phage tail protein [unclassified Shewanella]|mgnify:CR=1 FL=1|jgi:microcystin-dependent protein|uniref:phage tail protein n=1 Tax=Shewanella TaxID=22 RepID=UPI001B7AC4D8|nr:MULTISPECIES: tail fiber protein [unclassified Shewanella]MBP6518781.1 phage tail protein [Shewanella sp.]MCU7975325.1 tail fiber protein [Shewanella sp. SW36]MCU7986423.1 tail fiber protein [Shewanella sp. SW24]MCU7990715.1 tail fiber protein [Shewanella sp. SW1]MCU8035931.1 tail fiber protein [Shewanella sp. SM71]